VTELVIYIMGALVYKMMKRASRRSRNVWAGV